MTIPELPNDDWHTHVYVHCGWLNCHQCNAEADIMWAWDGLSGDEQGAAAFAARVVPYLTKLGWTLDGFGLLCPVCSANPISN